MATSCSQRVGSNGSHGSPDAYGHVGAWNPAECDSSMAIVTSSIEPQGLCTSRSSGTYRVTGSSSDRRRRSRSCITATAVSVLVIDPQ
jgi:hypothetical protein